MGRKLQRGFTSVHCAAYRVTRGGIGARMHGAPVLLLRTTGRRTGLQRETPVLYFPADGGIAIVASNGGADRHPCWYLNLRDHPEVEVQVGGEVEAMRARVTSDGERDRLWQSVIDGYPGYEEYQRRTERRIPVVVLQPAG